MSHPAIFLDRDGTIIEDEGHLGSEAEVHFFPFTFNALRLLQERFLLFIVTNQSGISLGRITAEKAMAVNNHVLSTLEQEGIVIKRLYCCGHTRDMQCQCIKPKPFFIREAEREFDIDPVASWSIGDHPHDVEFAPSAGGRGIYLLTGHGAKHKADIAPGTRCFENLLEAAVWLTAQNQII